MPPKATSDGQELPTKEQGLFRQLVKQYEVRWVYVYMYILKDGSIGEHGRDIGILGWLHCTQVVWDVSPSIGPCAWMNGAI